MQAQNLPFRFQEVFKLTNLGLDPSNFRHGNLTFESQKYIAVKEGNVSLCSISMMGYGLVSRDH